MITITRRVARDLRAVLRPRCLGYGSFVRLPPLALRAEADGGLRVRLALRHLALECLVPGPPRPRETLLLPLRALAAIAGRDDSPVALYAVGPRSTMARWLDIPPAREYDFAFPRTASYEVPRARSLAPFPRRPEATWAAPAGLLDALAELSSTTASAIRLVGGSDVLVDESGWRATLPGGYLLPWEGEATVAASPVFARRELPRAGPVELGRTARQVMVRAGCWTLWLADEPGLIEPPEAEDESGEV